MPATDLFPLTPDRAYVDRIDAGVIRKRSEDGSLFQRTKKGVQHVFELQYSMRSTADKDLISDFYATFRADWFKLTVNEYEETAGSLVAKDFAVTFLSEPEYEYVIFDAWNIRVTLIEDLGNTV